MKISGGDCPLQMRREIQKPKLQSPKQISSSKLSNQLRSDRLGLGRLKFVWALGFGIWDFGRAASAVS
jgi:hypothetical protein